MNENFRKAEYNYLTPPERITSILDRCDNFNCLEVITDEYEIYCDDSEHLFCSQECAIEYYGIKIKED